MTKDDLKVIVKEMDFMRGATNVYRTNNYIIRQQLSIEVIDSITVIYSKDTFFARTKVRDAQYEFVNSFAKCVNGKRVHASMTTRTYVD